MSRYAKTAAGLSKPRQGSLQKAPAKPKGLSKSASDPFVEDVNLKYDSITASVRRTINIALELGKLLAQKKRELGHGKWAGWIEKAQREHGLKFGARHASRYMHLANNEPEVRKLMAAADTREQGDLSLRDALRLLEGGESREEGRTEKTINPRYQMAAVKPLLEKLKAGEKKLNSSEKKQLRPYVEDQLQKHAAKAAEFEKLLRSL